MSDAKMSEHRIHESETEAGNMGSPCPAWRAFCSCGWSMDYPTTYRETYDRAVAAHLESERRWATSTS